MAMGFFQTTAGKTVAIVAAIVAVVVLVIVIKNCRLGGTDSPSDITSQMPYSDPNDPNLVQPRPGDPGPAASFPGPGEGGPRGRGGRQ
jgi:hypothetical protein